MRLIFDAVLLDHRLIPQVLEAPELLPELREWMDREEFIGPTRRRARPLSVQLRSATAPAAPGWRDRDGPDPAGRR